MKNYEINVNTLALIGENNKTKIYEDNINFVVDKSSFNIMEDSCEYFGSSLEGRKKGTYNLIGVTHKCPIIVEESSELIFFPTCSPRLNNCCWISLNNIFKYYSKNKDCVVIVFKNGIKIELNISFGIVDNQILRATRLESVLRGRKKEKNI